MKIAVLSRHRRLLALCGLSAALHLLVLQLAARHGARELMPAPGAPGPLVLRLAPPPSPRASAAPSQADAAATTPARAPASAPVPSAAPKARPAPGASAPFHTPSHVPAAPIAAAAPTQAAPAVPDTPAPPTAPDAASGATGDATALRMPARYRVRMPPSVRLVYSLTRRDAAGRQLPAQAARLDWRNDGGRYTLHMTGVLGAVASSGAEGDSGIQPQRFAVQGGTQRDGIAFDPDRGSVVFGDGSEAPGAPGMQDRASLLMQLAGIGLARPGQLQDVLEIVVADAGAARIERFQVMGEEKLATGAGAIQAVRLAELAAAGQPRLEVWLAPDLGWLPVQLRVTQADGGSATQVLARTEPAAP